MRQIPTIYFSKTKMHGEDVESVFVQLKKKESYLCGFLLVLKDTCKTFSPRRYPLRLAMAM